MLPPVEVFEDAVGPAGRWVVDIPRYVTPIGQNVQTLPAPAPNAEAGIFGVFADIPRLAGATVEVRSPHQAAD